MEINQDGHSSSHLERRKLHLKQKKKEKEEADGAKRWDERTRRTREG